MATATFEIINTFTSTGSEAGVTWSSVPSTYTDLYIVINAKTSNANPSNWAVRFNNESTGTNYGINMMGGGSSKYADRVTQTNYLYAGTAYQDWGSQYINILNYASTTTFKGMLGRSNNQPNFELQICGLWQSTAAVNTVTVTNYNGYALTTGSTINMYGIKAE
jgi:hypothetical protein